LTLTAQKATNAVPIFTKNPYARPRRFGSGMRTDMQLGIGCATKANALTLRVYVWQTYSLTLCVWKPNALALVVRKTRTVAGIVRTPHALTFVVCN
jgi:hypothetical protein